MKKFWTRALFIILLVGPSSGLGQTVQRMVIPAGTYSIGGGPGGGGPGGDGAPQAPNPGGGGEGERSSKKIQAYCVDYNRPAPLTSTEFKTVFAPQDAVTVSVGNNEYTLQEAINSNIVDIRGTQNDLDVRIFNQTQSAIEIEVHKNVVVGEAGDTQYGLPLRSIQNYDFSSSTFSTQSDLWTNIVITQLRQVGYEVNTSVPVGVVNGRAYEEFYNEWGFEAEVGDVAYDLDLLRKVNTNHPSVKLVSVRMTFDKNFKDQYLVFGSDGVIYRGNNIRQMLTAVRQFISEDLQAVYFDLRRFPAHKVEGFSASLQSALLDLPDFPYTVRPLNQVEVTSKYNDDFFSKGVELTNLSIREDAERDQSPYVADLTLKPLQAQRSYNLSFYFEAENHLRSAVRHIRSLFGPRNVTELSIAEVVAEARRNTQVQHGANMDARLQDQFGHSQFVEMRRVDELQAVVLPGIYN